MEATSSSRALLRRVPIGFRRIGGGDRVSPAPAARVNMKDEGHLRYYTRCGGKKKEKEGKRRMKAVKSLEKELSALCSVGVVGGGGEQGMVGEIKGQVISEAAELLLSQLKQLRAEEKEMKKKRKQEKAAMKATKTKNRKDDNSSSSESSESSDSECETVVKMSSLRTKLDKDSNPMATALQTEDVIEVAKNNIIADIAEMTVKPMDKIEVCMGGKCKRSGAVELLAEFKKKVGIEGAVVGCKCMGKCRNGPNVRVVNHQGSSDDGSLGVSKNPLCIGVSLEDVSSIVANFCGENKDVGLLPA